MSFGPPERICGRSSPAKLATTGLATLATSGRTMALLRLDLTTWRWASLALRACIFYWWLLCGDEAPCTHYRSSEAA